MHAPNTGALKYIKQTLTDLKGEIDNIIVGDVKTSFSTLDKSTTQEINKEMLDFRLELHKAYTEHFYQQQQHTHSSQMHMEPQIHYIIGHKTSLS